MTNYTKPCMHHFGWDIRKRWHISYYFKNPETGRLDRFREFGGINHFKSISERKGSLKMLLNARIVLLERGWSPYGEYFDQAFLDDDFDPDFLTVVEKVLANKQVYLKHTSYVTFRNRATQFKDFMIKSGYGSIKPREIKRKHIQDFIEHKITVDGITNRSRNNILVDIKSLFSKMIELDYLQINPCTGMKKVPTAINMHKVHSIEQLVDISNWMKQNDPYLLLFCRVFGYSFMRPCEAVKLRVGDIDLKNGLIHLPAEIVKTNMAQVKPIIGILKPFLEEMHLENYPKDFYLFSSKGHPRQIPTTRDFFTAKFQKVKTAIGLSKEESMYAIRHTFVCDLIDSGMVSYSEMMRYTGHTTMNSFEAYVRSLRKVMPKDVSSYFRAAI